MKSTVVWGAVALALLAAPARGAVEFEQSETQIAVKIGGKPFTTLYFGPDAPKPYLHPLRAHDGTLVTRSYPMTGSVAGEAHDHPHHRGLWFSHGDVNGYDFWANEFDQKPPEKKGRIVLKGVHKAGDGFIRADFEWLTPTREVLLTENRTMWFREAGDNRIIDFDITLRAEVRAVKLGDTKEGTFAVRVAAPLRETAPDRRPGQGVIVNAEGKRGEKETWGKRSPWVDYSGPVGGKTYGIAILDHPSNPKHPTYWHVRAYGLFAANMFGESDYYNDKSRDGGVTLQPGETLRLRYRVVIHPGDADQAGIARIFQSWGR